MFSWQNKCVKFKGANTNGAWNTETRGRLAYAIWRNGVAKSAPESQLLSTQSNISVPRHQVRLRATLTACDSRPRTKFPLCLPGFAALNAAKANEF